jgi:heme-degrading monooxygenase HmoA
MNVDDALWEEVVEHVVLPVLEDTAAEFGAAVARHGHVLAAAPGFLGMLLLRDRAGGNNFVLLIGWRDLQDRYAFRASPGYEQWRAAVHGYFAGPPSADDLTVAFRLTTGSDGR